MNSSMCPRLMFPWSVVWILAVWEVNHVLSKGQRYKYHVSELARIHHTRSGVAILIRPPVSLFIVLIWPENTTGCCSHSRNISPPFGECGVTFFPVWLKVWDLSWSWSHMFFTCKLRMYSDRARHMGVLSVCVRLCSQNDRNVWVKKRSPPSGLPVDLMWSSVPGWHTISAEVYLHFLVHL